MPSFRHAGFEEEEALLSRCCSSPPSLRVVSSGSVLTACETSAERPASTSSVLVRQTARRRPRESRRGPLNAGTLASSRICMASLADSRGSLLAPSSSEPSCSRLRAVRPPVGSCSSGSSSSPPSVSNSLRSSASPPSMAGAAGCAQRRPPAYPGRERTACAVANRAQAPLRLFGALVRRHNYFLCP